MRRARRAGRCCSSTSRCRATSSRRAASCAGVTLYDIDDLQRAVARHSSVRARPRRASAEGIVEEEIQRFAGWLGPLEVLPTIAALRAHGRRHRRARCWPRTRGAGSRSSPRDRARVEAVARAVVNRLLHEPTLRLRQLEPSTATRACSSCASCSGSTSGGGRGAGRAARGEVRPLRRATRVERRCGSGRAGARWRWRRRAGWPTLLAARGARRDRDDGRPRRARVGDKARWVDELEAALLAGEIDLAVHSAKDVPGRAGGRAALVAAPRATRDDPRDALVRRRPVARRCAARGRAGRHRARCAGARSCARCGRTSRSSSCAATSTRGCASSPRARSTRSCSPPRGSSGSGVRARRRRRCDFVPAPGQGTLALEARAGDERARGRRSAPVHDAATFAALAAERAAVRVLDATATRRWASTRIGRRDARRSSGAATGRRGCATSFARRRRRGARPRVAERLLRGAGELLAQGARR